MVNRVVKRVTEDEVGDGGREAINFLVENAKITRKSEEAKRGG